ncbi:MAG TPA: phosphate signaling complex protein PhoU [Quisquiliibacterium sp.]|nr:phosphate signaling complex protein PhoU [Quisquiliibacterium sp.]
MGNEHTYKPFDTDIARLRSAVTVMGGLVERQIERAVDAALHRDLEKVAQVLTDEASVNQLHLETDLRCNQVIAKRQPIAIDLREVIAVIHMINDLERIGDEAKKIAKKVRDIINTEPQVSPERVRLMSDLVVEMLRRAIDAFVRQDSEAARAVVARDEEVDALRDELTAVLMERITQDKVPVAPALTMIFMVQSIERIGDHAKNIAEFVVHIVDGIDLRYQGSRAKT